LTVNYLADSFHFDSPSGSATLSDDLATLIARADDAYATQALASQQYGAAVAQKQFRYPRPTILGEKHFPLPTLERLEQRERSARRTLEITVPQLREPDCTITAQHHEKVLDQVGLARGALTRYLHDLEEADTALRLPELKRQYDSAAEARATADGALCACAANLLAQPVDPASLPEMVSQWLPIFERAQAAERRLREMGAAMEAAGYCRHGTVTIDGRRHFTEEKLAAWLETKDGRASHIAPWMGSFEAYRDRTIERFRYMMAEWQAASVAMGHDAALDACNAAWELNGPFQDRIAETKPIGMAGSIAKLRFSRAQLTTGCNAMDDDSQEIEAIDQVIAVLSGLER
jgi:hypothetical protein